MLRNKLTVLGSGCFLAMSVHSALALANPDRSHFSLDPSSANTVTSKTRYIVQLKQAPAAVQFAGQEIPERFAGAADKADYDPSSSAAQAYRAELRNKQINVMSAAGVSGATYQYEHTFNGFAAELSETQVQKLRGNPDVLNVWPESPMKLDTANTPAFLGLTDPGGLHDLGVKGEDIIIGIVDSGVWPENPSLDDTGYDPIAATRPDWAGECDTGTDPEFACNNKLIGARFFTETAYANFDILPGEFDSPRDADGHGTHVLTTAGGNEDTPATLNGVDVGTVTGMAPRARVAAYKVCWNGSADGNSGCWPSDTVAAIDAAVADGVDVINMSISGSRTDLTDPVHAAFFNAAQAGVFASLSAGNSGPGPETVAHNVPWVTTVGMSTYDGEAALVGTELTVDSGPIAGSAFFSLPGGITTPIPEEGFSGELAAAVPALACGEGAGLENAEEVAGKIALIARGACAFSEKILNAQSAGAIGVVVYTDGRTPVAMGGDATGITVPGVMTTNEDGLAMADALAIAEEPVFVTMTNTPAASTATQVGNVMAAGSSRGGNQASPDIIKPDITAPGVQIFAGTTGSNVDTGVMGESYGFLSGTSMSSPHIAGLAALVREVNPGWSPAAVKSSLMTTARQDVVKDDGTTPADPFDFGAGHVVPNSAVNPGLVYDAGDLDYYSFLCGAGEGDFVESDFFAGACGALEGAGWPLDASDLNIPSIGVAELSETQGVVRIVTNVTDAESTYTASVDSPAGIDSTVYVLNKDTSTWEMTDTMTIPAGDTGIYQVMFSQNDAAVLDVWTYGSITWEDGTYSVRSPIAIRPVVPPVITAPAGLDLVAEGSSARITMPVEINYNGRFFANGMGLAESDVQVDTVFQDEDQTFTFLEPSLGFFFADVPEGSRIAKFALRDRDMPIEGIDLDLFVYECTGFSCTQVGTAESAGTDESVVLVDPNAKANLAVGDTYVVFVLGWSLNGLESVEAPLHVTTVDESGTERLSIRGSSRAVEGRTNRVYIGMSGLEDGEDYLGGILYTDEEGTENGITVIEVEADFGGEE